MAANTSHLPPEIIEIILSKLPVKPLLRFKSVSKSWNTTISDHVFIQNHHHRSQNSNSGNLFLRHDKLTLSSSSNRFSVVKLGDRKFQRLQVIESTFEWNYFLCFCEGLLLVSANRQLREFTLWNPSTRTHTTVSHPDRCGVAASGLCHDPITDDFKVVVVDLDSYSVYSCKNKSWIVLKKKYEIEHTRVGPHLVCYNSRGVCVDGASYWMLNATQIVYFDPRDDKFYLLQKPENANADRYITLVELRGSLCAIHWKIGDVKTFGIWTKGKGIDNKSWKELMTVENKDMIIRRLRPLCFVENKILVRVNESDRLLVYNPSEKRFERFEEDPRVIFHSIWAPIPFMESLFFPH